MTIPIPDIATLRNTIGAIGMNVDVYGTNGTYYWDNTNVLVDNGVTMVNVVGVPVGGWRLQMGDSGYTALTNTTLSGIATPVTVVSKMIKGNVLQSNRAISFLLMFNVSSGLTLLPSLTIKANYGSGSVTLVNNSLVSVSLSSKGVVLLGRIFGNGATNSQAVYGTLLQDSGTFGATGPIVTNGSMAVDSTVDQTFSITAQLSLTSGGVTLNFMAANVILL